MQETELIRLNKHDFLMFSMEDVITAQTQLLYFRFNEPLGAELIREAMRYMLTIYPKLRSVIAPTIFSWRYRIIKDDDNDLEILFNDAFRVEPVMASDTPEFDQYARNLLNEPFSLQSSLPIKMRFFPQGPKPILLVSLHHSAGDGVSWFHMLISLRKYLNGERPPLVPLDNPSMLTGLVKKPYSTIPHQLMQSYKMLSEVIKETKDDRIITPSARAADFWGPAGLYPTLRSLDFNTMRKRAKEIGYSVNVLHMTAFAIACSRGPAREKGNVISIAVSIDLRPFMGDKPPVFGNYVSIFFVRIPRKHWEDPREMLRVVNEQMLVWMDRFKNKEMSYPLFLEKLMTLVGKKNFAWGARVALRKRQINMSFAYSTMGNLDIVNKSGSRYQICELRSIVPQFGMFITSCSLGGKTINSISYPEAEYTPEEITAFYDAYEMALNELLALVPEEVKT